MLIFVSMANKLSFRSTVALVIGSQIGSGVFLLPASLSLLGPMSLLGWISSSLGAVLLALVFAKLSLHVVRGGGPHAYIERAFGPTAAFFAAWTYWIISWVSSIAVIIASVGYLSPLLGVTDPKITLLLQITVFAITTWINLRGATVAGSVEFVLTILKCVPLIVIPCIAICYLNPSYFVPFNPENLNFFGSMNTATIMTFWGFVGLEAATTTAAMVENPTKTIPRAVVLGTVVVALIYILNSIAITGVVPRSTLLTTQAPYVDAAWNVFGSGWDLTIAFIAFIACVGTLNAWVLTSGQIAKEAAKDRLFPPIFAKYPLQIAFFCTVLILFFTLTPHILTQLNAIIDLSVTAFVLVYLACSLAALRIVPKYRFVIWPAIAFAGYILLSASVWSLVVTALLIISGAPVYLWNRKRSLDKNLA